MKFYFSGVHRNLRWVAEIIFISANHLYLVNKEYFFIIPMYYKKKKRLCVIIRIALKEQF